MTEREDPDRLADELAGQADEMEKRSGGLQDEIQDVREDWQRKRGDESVPGAPPPREDSDRDEPGDQVNAEDAGRAATESPDADRDDDDEQHRDDDEDQDEDEDEEPHRDEDQDEEPHRDEDQDEGPDTDEDED